jgi:hypothetical protein
MKTCDCGFQRNWPFMVSHCRHGFALVAEKAPRKPPEGPTRPEQGQGDGVVAKTVLDFLKGL